MKRKNYLIVLMSLICMCFGNQYTWAQAGSNDATFNVADNGSRLNFTNTIVVQPDGKILAGGGFPYLVRYNPNGSSDNSFNVGNFNLSIKKIILQSDGKILVSGDFTNYNGTTVNRIARLNTDGSLDNTFNIGTGFNSQVSNLALQTDGKILVCGNFTTYNGVTANRIARLNTNGSLDTGFGGSGANNIVSSIAIQSDGKILIGGGFTLYSGISTGRITRLNTDGNLDIGFNNGGSGVNNFVNSIAIQSDGKILVGGNFTTYNGVTANRIARLNTNGSFDNTFNNGGSGFVGGIIPVQCITIQSNNIWVSGPNSYNGTSIGGIVRLNGSTGAIDNPANMGSGVVNVAPIYILTFQSDGKILVGGAFESYNGVSNKYSIVRLNVDGSLDNTFKNDTGIYDNGLTLSKIQSDDKIILYKEIKSYNGFTVNRIARLNTDGSLDNTFNITGTGFDSNVNTLVLQPDGKILVGGAFNNHNGTTQSGIARLNTNGSLDNTFNIGTGFNSEVYTLVLQTDGKILVGGFFTSYNGVTTNRIVRLNGDGTLDNTFSIGTGFDNEVYALVLQSDGKILATGSFNNYNGIARRYIARLNGDGSLDNTFNTTGTGFNSSLDETQILLQSDGKILIGGYFTSYNGITTNRIIRLNADGTIDNTFSIGTGFSASVDSMISQPDGKILIGGFFTSYNGTSQSRIIQLNPNGTLDATFNIGIGFNNAVYSLGTQKNGKIIAIGGFTKYNGVPRNGIIRLMPSCPNNATLSDLPTAPLLQPYNQTLIQNQLGGNITWSVTAGTLPAGLTLNSSTGVISGTPTTPVTAVFTVQASNGVCSISKEYNFVVDPIAGIEPKTQIIEKVYPNPSQDKIQIDLKQNGSYSFRMLNSLGKLVQEGKTEGSKAVLDISSLPQGLYFLEISGQKQSIKIIKQ